MVARGGRRDSCVVHEVHGVHAIMPVLAAERTARQRVLHDVEEFAVATVDFDFPIMKEVVGSPDARGYLVREVEADGTGTHAIRRQELLVEAHAEVQRKAMTDGPTVLSIDA